MFAFGGQAVQLEIQVNSCEASNGNELLTLNHLPFSTLASL